MVKTITPWSTFDRLLEFEKLCPVVMCIKSLYMIHKCSQAHSNIEKRSPGQFMFLSLVPLFGVVHVMPDFTIVDLYQGFLVVDKLAAHIFLFDKFSLHNLSIT